MEEQTVIRSKAPRAGNKPPGVPSSAFDQGRQRHAVTLDLDELEIQSGVPIPEQRGGRVSVWLTLFNRMKPGDMVALDVRQGKAFEAWGRKHKQPLARRALQDGRYGVWRLADEAQVVPAPKKTKR